MAERRKGIIVKRKDGSEIVKYDDPSFPSYIFDGYLVAGCGWERVPHYHEDVEIVSVKGGEMAYMVEGTCVNLKSGDTLFVNSGSIHYSLSTTNKVSRYLIAILNPKIICSSFAVEQKAVRPIVTDKTVPFVHFKKEDFDAASIYQLMIEMEHDCKGSEFLITKCFFEIWDIIMRRFTDAYRLHVRSMEESTGHNSRLKAMMLYIDEHYTERISLSDIASAGGVSQSLCNQIFNRLTEKSPIEYLMHYRSRKVADLLQTSDMSMAEIADVTGFTGASYMAETFKKYYNQSPREYKKAHK
ncbi:MAG: helix-turn-helix transcriptional regulator [Treponema sp.]|nr:helix-turn-helix transcriptional regulator [Treponema sp.]